MRCCRPEIRAVILPLRAFTGRPVHTLMAAANSWRSRLRGALPLAAVSSGNEGTRTDVLGNPTRWRPSIRSLERNSDGYHVVNAVHAVSLLDQYTESAALVGRIDKAPKPDDAIVYSEANVVIIDPGLGPDAVVQRLNAQLPIEGKLAYADFVVHNEGTLEETRRQVEQVWKEFKKCLKCAKVPKMLKVEKTVTSDK